jgi:hypothetical protein
MKARLPKENVRRPYEKPVLVKRQQLPIVVATGGTPPGDDDDFDDTAGN